MFISFFTQRHIGLHIGISTQCLQKDYEPIPDNKYYQMYLTL